MLVRNGFVMIIIVFKFRVIGLLIFIFLLESSVIGTRGLYYVYFVCFYIVVFIYFFF